MYIRLKFPNYGIILTSFRQSGGVIFLKKNEPLKSLPRLGLRGIHKGSPSVDNYADGVEKHIKAGVLLH